MQQQTTPSQPTSTTQNNDNKTCFERLNPDDAPEIDFATFQQPTVEDATILAAVSKGTEHAFQNNLRTKRARLLGI